jgi:membrane protease YdiL (CAAX protease family)
MTAGAAASSGRLSDTGKAAAFYALTLALGLPIALLARAFPRVGLLEVAYVFTPLVAVLVMMLVVTRAGSSRAGWRVLGLHRLGLSRWGLAVLVPLLAIGFAHGVVWSTGLADVARPEGPFGSALAPLWIVLAIVGLTLTQSLAEEVGWSGYLLPHLRSLGERRAMFLRGLGQGVWHLPLMLLTASYHPDGNRLVVVALFLATLTAAGFLYGYLRFTTDSVWPPTIAHSAHNAFWLVATAWTAGGSPLADEYLAGESGLLVVAAYVVAAVYVMRRFRPPTATARAGTVAAT